LHELYLIQSMINQISASAAERGVYRVNRIHLVNGQLSGANTEALHFAFNLFSDTPLFQYALLEVEEPELIGRCNSCYQTFKIEEYHFICRYCSKGNIEIVSGQELYIDYYEGD
jgi:hydrogenase nickel incorporation protein HypA/HybF